MAASHNALPGAWARLRRALPFVVLLVALGVTGAGAFRAHRAHRSHLDTAEALLRDYGTFAAWSFAARAVRLLDNGVSSTLHPVRPELVRGEARSLEELLAAGIRTTDSCGCGTPLAGRFAFHARLAPGGPVFTWAGEPPSGDERQTVEDAIVRRARMTGGAGHRLTQVGTGPGATLLALMVHHVRSDTTLHGVEVDPVRYREELERAFQDPDLLPSSLTRGAPNDSLVAVWVLGTGGDALYGSGPRAMPAAAPGQTLPERFGGLAVRAAVIPEAADQLVLGGMPTDRTPGALLLFGLAAALMVLSVFLLRKENELARLRSDFVASVSHELRTPVAQIRLFVETLRLGRVEGEAGRAWALERVERETLRLGRLLDRILHFHRADRGIVAMERVPLDVAEVVADAAASFEGLLRPGQAQLVVTAPAGLRARADADALRQVTLNLLENAVKYGPAGQTIRVQAEGRDGQALIIVEDQGPGVPLDERRVIWDAFRRGAAAVGSVTAGGGIGLALVRDIVQGHGGRAWVEDAPGGSARFVVAIPGLEAVAESGLGAESGASAPREAPTFAA